MFTASRPSVKSSSTSCDARPFSGSGVTSNRSMAALSADSRKLLLYDFKTQKWTDWITEPNAIGFPSWSRDGRYVHYDNTSTKEAAFLRVQVGQTRSEFLIDLKDMHRYGRYGWAWSGLALDDSALLVRDVSTDEIYSLDVELP